MSWKDIEFDKYLVFLSDWKSRTEIKEEFELSNVSSWHCVKYLSKLSEIQSVRNKGFRNRTTLFKARSFALKEIETCKREKGESQNEDIFSNTDNK